ncbi:MAG: S8 family serine peptidase [Alistipes sp.]|nr:S8 family serine peptidase [Alistipes sp.]
MMNNFKKLGALLLVVVTALACGDLLEENPGAGNEDFDGTRSTESEITDYYWYQGKKIPLTANKEYVNVILDEEFSKSPASVFVEDSNFQIIENDNHHGIIKLKFTDNSTSLTNYTSNKSDLIKKGHIKYVLPFYERGNGSEPIGTSDIFYLKLKNADDLVLLEAITKEHGVKIVKDVPYTPLWYILTINGSDFQNAIEASNWFYETGHFDDVDPAFMFDFRTNSTNDPLFDQLWGLKNNEYYGIDINVVNAWNTTKGAGINIAIVDQGIDPNHNDLAGNFHASSFDAQSGTSPSVFIAGNYHGTHVAGTVAAVGDNNLQVVGVAPESKILRVSHDLKSNNVKISSELASGINWAWQAGADVISNSWGDQGGSMYNQLHSTILEQAIIAAMNNGRSGKGAVVVFAAGNYAPVMDYPANFHKDILTVGSIDKTGKRSSFSGYGNTIDVVAPGENILSTLPGNAVGVMSGTSMAAPHAAGVAALVLSVSPLSTGQRVRDIIESSCRKLSGYYFSAYNTNGTYNNEVGYGLVDAYAAINKIMKTGIDFTLVNKSKIDISGIYIGLTGKVGGKTYTFISSDPGWIRPGETTGLPAYGGMDVSLPPGSKVTDVTLEIYAATWDDQILTINSWIQERSSKITYFNFYGYGKTVFISQEDITFPLNGDRLMLNITME